MGPTIARACALVLCASGLGVAVNAGRKDGLSLRSFAVATSCAAGAAAPGGAGAVPATVLAPTEAMRLCGDPGVLVADVRSPERFAAGHVTGAVHLPCTTS